MHLLKINKMFFMIRERIIVIFQEINFGVTFLTIQPIYVYLMIIKHV